MFLDLLATAGVFVLLYYNNVEAYEPPPIVYERPIETTQEAPIDPAEAPVVPVEAELPPISVYCSCIKTARLLGANIPMGTNASDLKPNSTPVVGGLVLLSYSKAHHVAYIAELQEKGVLIREGNYKRCEYTERLIPYDYKYITGFWYN